MFIPRARFLQAIYHESEPPHQPPGSLVEVKRQLDVSEIIRLGFEHLPRPACERGGFDDGLLADHRGLLVSVWLGQGQSRAHTAESCTILKLRPPHGVDINMSAAVSKQSVGFAAVAYEDKEFGLLIRVLLTYAAWLAMILGDLPASACIVIGIVAPLLFGGVIWHLRRSHLRSAVNEIAFAGALAFFPLAIWLAVRR